MQSKSTAALMAQGYALLSEALAAVLAAWPCWLRSCSALPCAYSNAPATMQRNPRAATRQWGRGRQGGLKAPCS